jgi:radical SAM superfamily enzyme YgiQ (UPF0313 family)
LVAPYRPERHFTTGCSNLLNCYRLQCSNMPSEELFILPRPTKTQTSINVTWAYPNSYLVGTSGLGYQLIWWLLEQNQHLNVLRAFTDYQDPGWDEAELVGFTLSWELDFSNVLSMLNTRSVPLLSADRDTSHPIVFGGGPVLSANPEPFADFFDVILLGDAEIMIPAFTEKWQQIRSNPSREAQLLELATVDGVYIPSLYQYSLDSNGSLQAVTPLHKACPNASKNKSTCRLQITSPTRLCSIQTAASATCF